jgi:hypothetical protein
VTPAGARGFGTAAAAKEAAQKHDGVTSFAILQNNPRPFMQPEFAWVAPLEFYMTRAMPAAMAGISVVEMVQG